MEVRIDIDSDKCIKCGRCVRVCPVGIFYRNDKDSSDISIRNKSYCIFCGHCVAVCPESAISHNDFPADKVHKVDIAILPSPESMMMLCRSRRSNRAFTKQQIPDMFLDQIVEAAHRAPTASNRQEVGFTLITDPDKLAYIERYTIDSFHKVVRKLKNPFVKFFVKPFMNDNYKLLKRMERLLKEYDKGNEPILKGATALLLIHTPIKNKFGRDDANLAYQNGSLMAECLGVAQFYTGYVCTAIRRDKKGLLNKRLGINGTIHAGMALGMAAFKYPKYIDRKIVNLNKIAIK